MEAGYEALQKHFDASRIAIERKNIRENLRPIISGAMRKVNSTKEFKALMKKENIGVIFRENDQKRIYGFMALRLWIITTALS